MRSWVKVGLRRIAITIVVVACDIRDLLGLGLGLGIGLGFG